MRSKFSNCAIFSTAIRAVPAIICLFFISPEAWATPVSIDLTNLDTLDTGYGLNGSADGTTDPNWTVTLLSGTPSPAPNQGFTSDQAYLVPNSFSSVVPEWAPNYEAAPGGSDGLLSAWITYANPTPDGSDNTGDVYQYETAFIAAESGLVNINFLSDNSAILYANGVDLGTNAGNPELGNSGEPNTDGLWLTAPLQLDVTAGDTYTLDFDVTNTADNSAQNPTGVRVELEGVPSVSINADPVPDTGSTMLLLGVTFGAVAIIRRRPAPRAS